MKARSIVLALVVSGVPLAGATTIPAGDCEAPQPRTDLSHCDLSHRKLAGRDLSGANLAGVMLDNADLRGARLSGADLRGSSAKWVNFTGADLREADLRGADLSGANLRGADLSDRIIQLGPIGSRRSYICYNATLDEMRCGCFLGTLAEFEKQVRKTHGASNLAREYLATVRYLEEMREMQLLSK